MAIRGALRSLFFPLFLGMMASLLAVYAVWLTRAVGDFANRVPDARRVLLAGGVSQYAFLLACVVGGLSIVFFVAAVLSGVHRGWVLRFIQSVCIGGYLVLIYAIRCATRAVQVYAESGIPFRGVKGERVTVVHFMMQVGVLKWILPVLAGLVVVHLTTTRRSTINLFTGETGDEPTGVDLLLEDLRTGGRDPEYRRCCLMSLGTHAVAILLIPLLLQSSGCATRKVDLPTHAEGGPPASRRITFVRKQVEQRKLVENPNSPILYIKPLDFSPSRLFDQIREATEKPYESDMARFTIPGNNMLGKGHGFGWPGGEDRGSVCFVRIAYNGSGWDDGLDDRQPSRNLMRELKRTLPDLSVDVVEKVVPVRDLARYAKGHAPPFVYMTGDGRVEVSDSEVRVLRQYLHEGGMLFADCGSMAFHQAFCSLASRLMPGDRLVELSDDDEIFDSPFPFPNGAPPLWHHGGNRAMGIRYSGRLCVFYHPGDLNDAWKTGRSGATPEKVEMAYRMGMNVMFYASKTYSQATAKHRR